MNESGIVYLVCLYLLVNYSTSGLLAVVWQDTVGLPVVCGVWVLVLGGLAVQPVSRVCAPLMVLPPHHIYL